jgi:hypothetical protein
MIASGIYLLRWFEISNELKLKLKIQLPALLVRVTGFLMLGVSIESTACVVSVTLEDKGDAFIRNVGNY